MSANQTDKAGKSRPMLFSGPMVRALLEGRKTQTRRTRGLEDVAKYPGRLSGEGPMGQLGYRGPCESDLYIKDKRDFKRNPLAYHWFLGHQPGEVNPIPVKCPHPVGSEIWVRESGWERPDRTRRDLREGADTWPPYEYTADLQRAEVEDLKAWGWKRRNSIHMPRWASRIKLKVTDVRVQRLQDISEEDAKAEGLKCLSKDGGQVWKWGIPDADGEPGNDDYGWHWQDWSSSPVEAYRRLWESINGKGSWDANPWIWAYTFKVSQ